MSLILVLKIVNLLEVAKFRHAAMFVLSCQDLGQYFPLDLEVVKVG